MAQPLRTKTYDILQSLLAERILVLDGAIGPTAKQMAISTRVDDPAWRGVTFDDMVDSYYEQVAALVEAGVDLLLPETVIGTLNLKACLFAIEKYFQASGRRLPVIA